MNNNNTPGLFKYILALDCETTGINNTTDDPSDGQQAISWGIIIADADSLKPIEELYVEIKWNSDSILARKKDPTFGKKTESIHGLTFDYLQQHGISEEEAVVQILNLIIKYWGPKQIIQCLGHNVHMFDLPFLRRLVRKYEVELPFSCRHYDSNSVGFITTGAYTSNALFDTMGFESRDSHNALEDAYMSLESCRRIRVLWQQCVGVKAYD